MAGKYGFTEVQFFALYGKIGTPLSTSFNNNLMGNFRANKVLSFLMSLLVKPFSVICQVTYSLSTSKIAFFSKKNYTIQEFFWNETSSNLRKNAGLRLMK